MKFNPEDFFEILKLNGLCSESVIQIYGDSLARVVNKKLEQWLADVWLVGSKPG